MHANDSKRSYKYSWCSREQCWLCNCDAVLGYTLCSLTLSRAKRRAKNNGPTEWMNERQLDKQSKSNKTWNSLYSRKYVQFVQDFSLELMHKHWILGAFFLSLFCFVFAIHPRLFALVIVLMNGFYLQIITKSNENILDKLHPYVFVGMNAATECSQLSRLYVFAHLKKRREHVRVEA